MPSPAGLELGPARVLSPHVLAPAHLALLEAALTGRDGFGVLPADPVRWLLAELASLWLPGIVLVVDPLDSLTSERRAALQRRLIAARCTLPAASDPGLLVGGSRVVHLAPRAITAEHMASASLVVIEHAHSASCWGHELRPEYLSLTRCFVGSGRPPLLALTGASTQGTVHDITRKFGLREPCLAHSPAVREDVHITVTKVRANDKLSLTLEQLRARPGPAVIIATTADVAAKAWTGLVRSDVPAALYHAELDMAARAAARNALVSGRARVAVTVGAQGLLLEDIGARSVVHWDVPESLESYADQLGCGARADVPVSALLLYERTDASLHRLLAARRYPTRHEVEHALSALATRGGARFGCEAFAEHMSEQKALVFCHELERLGVFIWDQGGGWLSAGDSGASTAAARRFEELRAHDERRLEQMLDFAEQERCRSVALRRYFGESAPAPCGRCDVCLRPGGRRKRDTRGRAG